MFSAHDIDKPVFVPGRRSEIPRLVREAFGLLKAQVEEGVQAFLDAPSREGLANTQNPVPSQSSSLISVLRRLQKPKRCPESGSSCRTSRVAAMSPRKDFLMSVAPGAK